MLSRLSDDALSSPFGSEGLAISVKNVSKKFRLFRKATDRLKEALHPRGKLYHDDFWALSGVSFDVKRGEIVGIMGRNGSGKSTLLQIMTGVMQASQGEVHTNGRISALLELGAGFNPEFTGRENVMLNGAIMGFSRREMLERMPSIEAFAEVGQFFDQPVKTYSSGMFVRVAFASAINIDPEILIVDEALAVGDAKFQHKCYQKIESFRAAGKTIVLVTHDVGQITSHCDRAILLNQGEVLMDGAPRDVADKYISLLFAEDESATGEKEEDEVSKTEMLGETSPEDIAARLLVSSSKLESRPSYCKDETRYGDGSAEIVDCVVESEGALDPPQIMQGDAVNLYIKVIFKKSIVPSYGFGLKTVSGIEVYGTNTFMQGVSVREASVGSCQVVRFSLASTLQTGEYFLDIGVTGIDGSPGGRAVDVRRSVIMLRIAPVRKKRHFDGLLDLVPEFELMGERDVVRRS